MKNMKTAVVTGAGTGIGKCVSRMLAERKYRVFLLGRREEPIAGLTREINLAGGMAEHLALDVTDAKAVGEFFRGLDSLDLLVNNAGTIQPIGRITDTDPAEWARCVEINLNGAYFCAHGALPLMLKNGGGTIINVSSGAAGSPKEGWSAYCAAKAGLMMFSQALHLEYGSEGIRVFSFRPGVVHTDMQRLIRESGINPVSKLKITDLAAPEIPATGIIWLAESTGPDYLGEEIDVRDPDFRKKAAIP